MNQPWTIIQTLTQTSSRLAKESIILSEAINNNAAFFEGCNLALNSFITFGVNPPRKTTPDGPGLTWQEFKQSVLVLINRTTTGNAARQLLLRLADTATQEQWSNWYSRILQKDIKCGVSEITINKQAKKAKRPEYVIPEFTCQLATDSAGLLDRLQGPKLIDTKMDGVRCLTIVYPTGIVEQYSRNGKVLQNFPHIKAEFANCVADEKWEEAWVFDGEVVSHSFQDLMKQVHRKVNVESQDAELYLFDMLPLRDFERGRCDETQEKRRERLTHWYNNCQSLLTSVKILGTELVDLSTTQGQEQLSTINKAALAAGAEGIMIKDPLAPYECKRGQNWFKLKPWIELDLTVVALEKGTGKNQDKLGALVCSGVDAGRTITVNVGSGLSDLQRSEIWASQTAVIGQVVEVRADAVTQSQDGSWSLRFPRFKRWRGFAAGEKI